MEWTPDAQDQAPFWPGNAERRGPKWVPIFVAIGVVIVVLAVLIWWLGGDDETPSTSEEPATQVEEEPQEPEETGTEAIAGDPADESENPGTTISTTTTTTTTSSVPLTTTTFTVDAPDDPSAFGPPRLSTNSTVSTVGLDEVHFGMTVAAAQQAAGTALIPIDGIGECYHVVPYDAPDGIVFLVSSSTIERVDINSGPVTTRSGVGVGSPESMVTDLFEDFIERQVRADGTVDLVFVPTDPGDRNYRVVFNVLDGQVRTFKSGRLPQVLSDTGCE